MVGGPKTLSTIFDNRKVILFGDGINCIEVNALAIKRYDNETFGLLRDYRLDQVGIDIEGIFSISTNTGLAPKNAADSAVAM